MRGRKPKSNIVRLREGNPGERPLENKVGSDGNPPRMPENLTADAKKIWDEIVQYLSRKNLLDKVDALWIEIFANAYARKRAAEVVIACVGATYETEGKGGVMIRTRPEVGIAERAEKQITRMLNDAALTPAAREKLVDPSQRDLPFGNRFNDI